MTPQPICLRREFSVCKRQCSLISFVVDGELVFLSLSCKYAAHI